MGQRKVVAVFVRKLGSPGHYGQRRGTADKRERGKRPKNTAAGNIRHSCLLLQFDVICLIYEDLKLIILLEYKDIIKHNKKLLMRFFVIKMIKNEEKTNRKRVG